MHTTDPIWKKRCPFETGTYTPCPPVRRTGKGSAEDPKAPTLQGATRGPRSTHLASGLPGMPEHPPCKMLPEDAGAPTGGPGRLPATRDAKAPLETLGILDAKVSLGALDTFEGPWKPWTPWTPGVPGDVGVLGAQMEALGALGHLRGPWRPRGRGGASGASGVYNCKNGFWSVLENHRFLKKSRKSYQNFRNNSKSQTMKSAQDFFYRFWDRAIMTQSIIAVFANRGGASAQYRAKKVSHN